MKDKVLEQIKEKLYTSNEYGYEYSDTAARLTDQEVEYLKNQYEIKTDVHRMCINCQARQIIKYNGQKTDDAYQMDRFQVPCNYVAGSLPKGSNQVLQKMMTEKGMEKDRALMVLKSAVDPVAWAEMMFDFDDSTKGTQSEWYMRPYQKEQLRCTSQRYVLREGRRSGKSWAMSLKIVYLALNNLVARGRDSEGNPIYVGPRIMIITPYQAQLTNLFGEIEKLLKLNADLSAEVTSGTGGSLFVKTPFFKMKFANGAVISGFVSGTGVKNDGSSGGTMRGQNANILYLDEMDMIPEEVIDQVVRPILLTDKNVILLASSTPIGERGRFYSWCRENGRYKEDYYPSTVLGDRWETIKHEIIAESTKESFAAEYMAEFIETGHGVFKTQYIQNARADYSYDESCSPDFWRKMLGPDGGQGIIKVLGIDWNKNAGSEFVVTAFVPSVQKFFVIDATNISAGEFSSLKWKEEVLRLNFKHQPDYIYADEGYGHHIIEDINLIAHEALTKENATPYDQQTAKLVERMVAYNFSSTVHLTSPIDGTEIKKPAKEYLVENSVRIFEDQRIFLPEGDRSMVQQLGNYIVVRRSTTTGKPVYGSENKNIGDHRLDALMLSLAGLSLEFGIYSKSRAPSSAPTQFTKSELDQRSNRDPLSPWALISGTPFQGVPGGINIERGSTDENEGRHRGYRGVGKGSRGNIAKEVNVFDEMWNRAYEPAAQGQQAPSISSHGIARRKTSSSRRSRSITRRKKR